MSFIDPGSLFTRISKTFVSEKNPKNDARLSETLFGDNLSTTSSSDMLSSSQEDSEHDSKKLSSLKPIPINSNNHEDTLCDNLVDRLDTIPFCQSVLDSAIQSNKDLGSFLPENTPLIHDDINIFTLNAITPMDEMSSELENDFKKARHSEHRDYDDDDDSFQSPERFKLSILGISENGIRTRVETQVKIILRIDRNSSHFTTLTLPAHQMQLDESNIKPNEFNNKENFLESDVPSNGLMLRARIIRSGSEDSIYACHSCIMRERKRTNKKRSLGSKVPMNSIKPANDVSSIVLFSDSNIDQIKMNEAKLSIDSNQIDSQIKEVSLEKNLEKDRERIIVFAGKDRTLQILNNDVLVPIRLTCYCRHHEEHVGFRLKLELIDHLYRLVATATSPPILVTDDHKSIKKSFSHSNFDKIGPGPLLMTPKMPLIHMRRRVLKVCPADGPLLGGVDVTVFGEGFTKDQTIIFFGSIPSTIICFVSSSIVIVRLPPAIVPGPVQVQLNTKNEQTEKNMTETNFETKNINVHSENRNLFDIYSSTEYLRSSKPFELPDSRLKSGNGSMEISNLVIFTYKNDLDSAMMELALQLIGMKMTGQVDDARNVAFRIISELSPATKMESFNSNMEGKVNLKLLKEITDLTEREKLLITCLVTNVHITVADLASIRTAGGQTLLHLAAYSRFDHLFEYLGALGKGILLKQLDGNQLSPVDILFLAGGQSFIFQMGMLLLEESSDGMEVRESFEKEKETYKSLLRVNFVSRYSAIVNKLKERINLPKESFYSCLIKLSRSPERGKIMSAFLRNIYWRNIATEPSRRAHYLHLVGVSICTSHRKSMPFDWRLRDVALWFSWVPILFASLILWYTGHVNKLASPSEYQMSLYEEQKLTATILPNTPPLNSSAF